MRQWLSWKPTYAHTTQQANYHFYFFVLLVVIVVFLSGATGGSMVSNFELGRRTPPQSLVQSVHLLF